MSSPQKAYDSCCTDVMSSRHGKVRLVTACPGGKQSSENSESSFFPSFFFFFFPQYPSFSLMKHFIDKKQVSF